jgi:desulfoferrodoxin (superoxide reductase-like protein)
MFELLQVAERKSGNLILHVEIEVGPNHLGKTTYYITAEWVKLLDNEGTWGRRDFTTLKQYRTLAGAETQFNKYFRWIND